MSTRFVWEYGPLGKPDFSVSAIFAAPMFVNLAGYTPEDIEDYLTLGDFDPVALDTALVAQGIAWIVQRTLQADDAVWTTCKISTSGTTGVNGVDLAWEPIGEIQSLNYNFGFYPAQQGGMPDAVCGLIGKVTGSRSQNARTYQWGMLNEPALTYPDRTVCNPSGVLESVPDGISCLYRMFSSWFPQAASNVRQLTTQLETVQVFPVIRKGTRG